MRVDFELSCGTSLLRIGGDDYEIQLRTCHVQLQLENCAVLPQSRYEHRLGKGSFEVSGTEAQSRGVEHDAGLGIEGSLGASVTTPSAFAKLTARFKRASRKSLKSEETVRSQSVTDLVVTSGQDRWQVGDPVRGDARRRDGRLLGTYFGEERDRDGDPKPLCVVGRTDPAAPVIITVSASASLGHVLIERADRQSGEVDRKEAGAALKPMSSRAVKEHSVAKAGLRNRVAGLVMAKALGESQRQAGFAVADGEFMIALQSLGLPAAQAPARTQGGEGS
ncbi:hypothetical protein [Methylobacterium sp. WCS2018Hpa-22]|uniref:hypothetical protein n=1 Tax=Methylobacterium sp. WCS2018Hpa-22 TaxID=3073633 RepID=UPI00288B6FB9|nr:hypothetical protein [Methylobacterium sp. WCS2018Hpa-22]